VIAASGPTQIARMFDLLAILAEAPENEYGLLASPWLGVGDDASANAAVEAGLSYIFDNLTGDIRLSKAAQLAYMSEPTFSKYFKRASGMTFSNMVKRLRIAHARRLIDTTDLSVAQIASASGYNNMSNFNRQFLSEVGMTPSAYRKLDPTQKPPARTTRTGTKARQPS
jgi:AraC-like DNA-binding protein